MLFTTRTSSISLAESLSNQGQGMVYQMAFGNGGTNVDPTGIITYLSPNSTEAIKECYRILKNDGKIYFQVPFIVGYHPGPTDFYRFTKEGIKNF